jgi:hypothetical protein
MKETISKLFDILYLVQTDYEKFSNEFSPSMLCSGDREFDGAVYEINLTENLFLYITSEEYKITQIEIISKSNSILSKIEIPIMTDAIYDRNVVSLPDVVNGHKNQAENGNTNNQNIETEYLKQIIEEKNNQLTEKERLIQVLMVAKT